jgi:hypothetical protein
MALLSLAEKSQTFNYVLLTTKVVQVLQKFEKKIPLKEQEKQILERGAKLIEKIIEGAILVEGKEFNNLSPTQEGLSAYGYALSTLETLNLLNEIKGFTDFFGQIYKQLKDIQMEAKKPADIAQLERFFLALGSAFRGDILKERYTPPSKEYPVLRKSSVNATSLA